MGWKLHGVSPVPIKLATHSNQNSLYNVDSPGGYQMTGMTIPGVDILGSKTGYSPDRPWLFEDFDQLQFYPVSEEEYEKELAVFNSGRYEYKWEEVTFDMAEHNRLLNDTKEEVAAIRARQRKAQAEMDKIETEMLERWAKEKAERGVPVDKVQSLLQGRFCRSQGFAWDGDADNA